MSSPSGEVLIFLPASPPILGQRRARCRGQGSAGGRPRSGRRSWRRTSSGRMLCSSEKEVVVTVLWAPRLRLPRVCSRAGASSAGGQAPGWAAGHSFARWCWHGVVRQVVRLGGINQEGDRAVEGSDNKRSAPSRMEGQTQSGPRPAGLCGQTESGPRPVEGGTGHAVGSGSLRQRTCPSRSA